MQIYADKSPAVIPIPQHPGLVLICTEPERYPPTVIAHLVDQITRWTPQDDPSVLDTHAGSAVVVTDRQIKELLRHIHAPHHLAAHPLAAHWVHVAPEQRGTALAQFLTSAIATLEHPTTQAERYVPGTILRMRYIERTRAKWIIRHLHLSERHYYRLHRSGLHWLAGQVEHYIRHDT